MLELICLENMLSVLVALLLGIWIGSAGGDKWRPV